MQCWGYRTEYRCSCFRAVCGPPRRFIQPTAAFPHGPIAPDPSRRGVCDKAGLSFFREVGRRHWLQLPEQLVLLLSGHFLPFRDEHWQRWQPWAHWDSPTRRRCSSWSWVICAWPANLPHPASVGWPEHERWAPSLAKESAAAAAGPLREAAGACRESLLAMLCKGV